MIFSSEPDLANFAESLGTFLRTSQRFPICLELVGDVGAGKTTFTRYLAKGLGVKTSVTSPSFTISKRYSFSSNPSEASAYEKCENNRGSSPVGKNFIFELIHYDFYRLDDPGLMADDLAESLTQDNAITVLEWADSVANILPKNHLKITFKIEPSGSRNLTFNKPLETLIANMKGTK